MSDRAILMGVIGKPHGVAGLCHVRSFTADAADLARYSPLSDGQGRQWHLSWAGDGVARLCDADGKPLRDRAAAERLTNEKLYAPRSRLPAVAEDEFYLADLIGLAARSEDGSTIGVIAAAEDHGGGLYLEITRDGTAALLLPFTRACVPEIDVAGGYAVVVPPVETLVTAEAAAQAEAAAAGAGSEGRAA